MAACEVCTGQDHGQQIVEVVRNTASQNAQALEFLGVLQPKRQDLTLLVRAEAIGDIGRNATDGVDLALGIQKRKLQRQVVVHCAVAVGHLLVELQRAPLSDNLGVVESHRDRSLPGEVV